MRKFFLLLFLILLFLTAGSCDDKQPIADQKNSVNTNINGSVSGNGSDDVSDDVSGNGGGISTTVNDGIAALNAKDYTKALQALKPLADQGNPEAQYLLGTMYQNGLGVTKDYTEAAKWYKKAADQGNVKAQLELGGKYFLGEGVNKDYKEAAKWLSLAVEKNNAKAQFALGALYYLGGNGLTRDYAEAFRLTKLSAEQGLGEAQYFLANMYRNGQGVAIDLVRAYMWVSLSTANLSPEAASDSEVIKNIETLKAALVASITATQKQQAEQLATDCKNKNYKNC